MLAHDASIITTQSIIRSEFASLIEFDNRYLLDVMLALGVPSQELPPPFTISLLESAIQTNDILEWIYVDYELAGYYWFEIQSDCLFIGGVAIKSMCYGKGLSEYILNLAEKVAREHNLTRCKLAVIPLNGRAVNAYLKHEYHITECNPNYFGSECPDRFRLIMEKNLVPRNKTKSDGCLIMCTDYEKLKNATDNGLVGVELIRSKSGNNSDNLLRFE